MGLPTAGNTSTCGPVGTTVHALRMPKHRSRMPPLVNMVCVLLPWQCEDALIRDVVVPDRLRPLMNHDHAPYAPCAQAPCPCTGDGVLAREASVQGGYGPVQPDFSTSAHIMCSASRSSCPLFFFLILMKTISFSFIR